MAKELFCHVCDDYKEVVIVQQKEVYPVKGENIEITANVCKCSTCGTELFDMEIDKRNMEVAFDLYRKKNGLLSPLEIQRIREMYGISQRSFSKLLRWGDITMNRYETGAIQDKPHNNTLLLLKNPHNMLDILNNNSGILTPSKEKKLRERIDDLLSEKAMTKIEESIFNIIDSREDIYTGFKRFDFEKFKSLVLIFSLNEDKLFKTKLMKLLWYVDNLYFKMQTVSITGLQYARLPRGPVVEKRNLLLGLLEEQNIVQLIEDDETSGEYLVPILDMNEVELDDDELYLAKLVSDKFKQFNCKSISDYSHKELAWQEVKTGSLIPYSYAKYIEI